MKVSLRTLKIDWFDYSSWEDPYLLMTKVKLISDQHPKFKLFSKLLTKQQEFGFYEDQLKNSEVINRKRMNGVTLKGHTFKAN